MTELVGRQEPIGVLEALLNHAAGRQGGALVLRGEAGIGKTSLLEYGMRAATQRGMRVLSVTAVQGEVHVPYAGLESLVRTRLAAGSPYRAALDVIDLLAEPDEPALLAIEDAQWLDGPTWETLAFLGRRIESDRIALLMAVRDGEDMDRRLTAAGLPELRVEPLDGADAAKLLDRVAPGLAPSLRGRVLDEAAGNPLGVVELGSAAARSGGAALLPTSLPLSTRVERTFGGLVAELPPVTQLLLRIAALDDHDDLHEIVAAAALVEGAPVAADAIEPAVAARLVAVDERYHLRFRHPLLRSALRQQAPAGLRRRVHAALARLVSADPDRQIWHRAAASPGPDEALARELSDLAFRSRYLDVTVPLGAIERAITLSEDPAERGRRQLFAVEILISRGDRAAIRELLATIDQTSLRGSDRAALAWFREAHAEQVWPGAPRLGVYADLIDAMRDDGDHALALLSLHQVCLRIFFDRVDDETERRFLAVADAIDGPPDQPTRVQAVTLIAPVRRGAAGLGLMRQAVDRLDLSSTERADFATPANALGAFDLTKTFAEASIPDVRAKGRIGILVQLLNAVAYAHAGLGDARAAVPVAAECVALSEETAQSQWALAGSLSLALAEALRGDTDAARARAGAAEQVLQALRRFPMLALVQRVRGVAALADGRADEAYRELARLFDPADPAYHAPLRMVSFGHLAEAAALAGRRDELAAVTAEMEPIAEQSQSPALAVGLAYARAVLTDGYPAALAADLTEWPFDRARLQLAYGAHLRRTRRVADSRAMFRAAAATFDALGAVPWADRARTELRASGETRRKPVDTLAALTPQEQQIARLAADGLSNKEIGERLFLSPRTVSTHLYRIYPKVGVKSRAELAAVITSSDVR
ncbi:LuxR C-terminal-related transcriptional regulator [Dactylosporangium sp. CS-047395]|uniref:helix-turn-helix transcriptional regulator n=1 Tax=Dactylosporangium sp. CS-047395 TaxID=3239936 RepID=UPI003D8D8FF8